MYFALYIPVDDEINEGDIILATLMDSTTRVCKCKEIRSNNEILTDIWDFDPLFPDTYLTASLSQSKKVKLFICRTARLEEMVNPTSKKVFLPFNPRIKLEENPYIIIGEVSPYAKWVKEGDKFDEDELYPFLLNLYHPDESMIYSSMDEMINDDINEKKYLKEVKIKCPCCETFK